MNNIKDFFKDIKSSPRKQALAFFGFYLIFFIILSLLARRPIKTNNYNETNKKYPFSLINILNKNYDYTYTITIDDMKNIYKGQKYNENEHFYYNEKEFLKINNNYYENNPIWIKIENPNEYSKFMDIEVINNIIEKGMYESKTTYESGKTIYNFLISSNTLNEMINNINTDYLEEPNKFQIITDDKNNVNKIVYNLSSYCLVNNICQKSLNIELSYENFGEVEEINNIE